MSIDIKKFVNVNINYAKETTGTNVRHTVALITSEGSSGTRVLATSYEGWKEHAASGTYTQTEPYVRTFFSHGGTRLLILEGASSTDAEQLEDEYIVVAIVGQNLTSAKSTATSFDLKLSGVHRKILVARAVEADILTDPLTAGISCLAVKYSESIGSEMTIAAYLSKINVYGTDTVHDYAFTSENIQANIAPEIDDTIFDLLQEYNFNFNIALGGATRNISGNMTSGRALVNEFMLIMLHQTLTEQVLQLLVTKIKGDKALAAIRTVVTQELNNYVQNGYLSTSKIWDLDDWNVLHNGRTFTIIANATPLTLGYYVQVLPWSALSSGEINSHNAPPIYVVIADAYGVRQINLFGEVI